MAMLPEHRGHLLDGFTHGRAGHVDALIIIPSIFCGRCGGLRKGERGDAKRGRTETGAERTRSRTSSSF